MKRTIAIFGLLFCAFFSNAQKKLIGNVLAKDSKLPVASASIFLSNTSVGTISKDNGSFVLQPFPEGRFDLVVSMIGYELKYDLNVFEFNYSTRVLFYQGYPLFSDLEAKNDRVETRWKKNREETYNGSIMHFMRSLYRNTLEAEGYEVRRIKRNKEKKNQPFSNGSDNFNILINTLLKGDSIAFVIDSVTLGLQFKDHLQVVYKRKYMPESYRLTQKEMWPKQPMTAEIFMPDTEKVVVVLANGSYFSGKDVLALGYWAWSEKLSNMLPLDYSPPKKK